MPKPSPTVALDVLKIADPCHEDWDGMVGDDRVRFCGSCRMSVFNLSAMTRPEAERLVASREGRLCVRFYQRADGTVITRDCNVVRRALRRSRAMVAGMCSAVASLVMVSVGFAWPTRPLPGRSGDTNKLVEVKGEIEVQKMGKVAPPVMGMVPLPPATQPATQPTTQPSTRPATQPGTDLILMMGGCPAPPAPPEK